MDQISIANLVTHILLHQDFCISAQFTVTTKKKSLKVVNIHLLQARTNQSSWGRAAFPQIFAEVDLLLNDNDSEKKNIATKNKN